MNYIKINGERINLDNVRKYVPSHYPKSRQNGIIFYYSGTYEEEEIMFNTQAERDQTLEHLDKQCIPKVTT